MSNSDVSKRQILMSKEGPSTERVNINYVQYLENCAW